MSQKKLIDAILSDAPSALEIIKKCDNVDFSYDLPNHREVFGKNSDFDLLRYPPSLTTPLHLAAFLGHSAVVGALLDKGADPLKKTNGRHDAYTPLHMATLGNVDVQTVILLCQKAPVLRETPDSAGNTPLHYAAKRGAGYEALNQMLYLDKGGERLRCNPNVENHDKETPLHFAAAFHTDAENDLTKTCDCLLQHGADPRRQDKRGNIPLKRVGLLQDKLQPILRPPVPTLQSLAARRISSISEAQVAMAQSDPFPGQAILSQYQANAQRQQAIAEALDRVTAQDTENTLAAAMKSLKLDTQNGGLCH